MDVTSIISAATGAFEEMLHDDWPRIRAFSEEQLSHFAAGLKSIEKLLVAKEIDEGTAKALGEIRLTSLKTAMLAIQGMTLLAIERAINRVIRAINGFVRDSLGFELPAI